MSKHKPVCCPHCGQDGAVDGQGTFIKEFVRYLGNAPDERVTQEWYQHHCPECGEKFALCRETTTEVNQDG